MLADAYASSTKAEGFMSLGLGVGLSQVLLIHCLIIPGIFPSLNKKIFYLFFLNPTDLFL